MQIKSPKYLIVYQKAYGVAMKIFEVSKYPSSFILRATSGF